MRASLVFSRCRACTHAAFARAGALCGLCGGEAVAEAPPEGVFETWRCHCAHCLRTPC